MTKVLILGATGMLGHKLYQVLDYVFDVAGTIRSSYKDISKYGIFNESSIIPGVDALDISLVEKAIEETNPGVLVNCAGIVKALVEKEGVLSTMQLNSLLPHQLHQICRKRDIRLIQVSTDCVFSGSKGNYKEDDPSDAEDIYGKTKYLGEVSSADALTIRTSIIGRELVSSNGLVEWFLSNRGGEVQGYTNAIFSGFPTLHLSRIIADIIENHGQLSGIYHVSSEPISKFELINLINRVMGLNIKVKEYPDYYVDRSLDSSLYREKTGFAPPSWEQMVEELASDATQYVNWR
ncbi:dTDP-4-dehydrorhamnose reductase family protein [Chloroflexota bacterium]